MLPSIIIRIVFPAIVTPWKGKGVDVDSEENETVPKLSTNLIYVS